MRKSYTIDSLFTCTLGQKAAKPRARKAYKRSEHKPLDRLASLGLGSVPAASQQQGPQA